MKKLLAILLACMMMLAMAADDMELVINQENADAMGLVIPEDMQ